MSIKAGIQAIHEGNLTSMKTNFIEVIMEKAINKLEEKKINIAKTLCK